MGRNPGAQTTSRGIYDCEASADEKAAQLWHESTLHVLRSGKTCWCCCPLCKTGNPYERDARKAALADIADRIRESQKHIRPPDKRKGFGDLPWPNQPGS